MAMAAASVSIIKSSAIRREPAKQENLFLRIQAKDRWVGNGNKTSSVSDGGGDKQAFLCSPTKDQGKKNHPAFFPKH